MLNNLETLNIKKGSDWGSGIAITIIFIPLLLSSFFPAFFIDGLDKFLGLLHDECIHSFSIKYGFDDKDLIEYDLKKYLIEKVDKKEKIIKDEKESKNIDEKTKEKSNKEGNEIEVKEKKKNKQNLKKQNEKLTNVNKFFTNLLFYIGPIQCLIKAKELSKELFDLFEKLKNRKEKEWISYKIHEFN